MACLARRCSLNIRVKLVHDNAIVPVQMPGDAGADLSVVTDAIVQPGGTVRVPLGICIELSLGYMAFVLPRSGLLLGGLTVLSPPIDADYRGEISAIVHNTCLFKRSLTVGMRIAQLVVLRVPTVKFCEASVLSETSRGDKGFGSSGLGPREPGNGG